MRAHAVALALFALVTPAEAAAPRPCASGSDAACVQAVWTARRHVQVETTTKLAARGCRKGGARSCEAYADIERSQGRLEAALATLDKWCSPKNGAACGALGRAYADRGSLVEAERAATRGCNADSPAACRVLGLIEHRTGRPGGTPGIRAACAKADAEACLIQARIELAAGEAEAGRATMTRACDAGLAEACATLARIRAGDGQSDVADDLVVISCRLGRTGSCVAAADRPRAAAALQNGLAGACAAGDQHACGLDALLRVTQDPGRAAAEGLGAACEAGAFWWCNEASARAARHIGLERAAALARHGCEAGDASACSRVAVASGSMDTPTIAATAASRACLLGRYSDCMELGRLLASGAPPPPEVGQLKERCAAGDLLSCIGERLVEVGDGRESELILAAQRLCGAYDEPCHLAAWLRRRLSVPSGPVDARACDAGIRHACLHAGEHAEGRGKLELALEFKRRACRIVGEECADAAMLLDGAPAAESLEERSALLEQGCHHGDGASCRMLVDQLGDDEASQLTLARLCSGPRPEGCVAASRHPSAGRLQAELLEACAAAPASLACVRAASLATPRGAWSAALAPLEKGCAAGRTSACATAGKLRLKAGGGSALASLKAGCEGGASEACLDLGQVSSGHERGMALLRACAHGLAAACVPAGWYLETTELRDRAPDLYRRGCYARHRPSAAACRNLARVAATSKGEQDDASRAWMTACQRGDRLACAVATSGATPDRIRRLLFWELRDTTTVADGLIASGELERAVGEVARLCGGGASWACHSVALMLATGAQDIGAAREPLAQACQDGVPWACGTVAWAARPGASAEATLEHDQRSCDSGWRGDCLSAARSLRETGRTSEADALLQRTCASGWHAACALLPADKDQDGLWQVCRRRWTDSCAPLIDRLASSDPARSAWAGQAACAHGSMKACAGWIDEASAGDTASAVAAVLRLCAGSDVDCHKLSSELSDRGRTTVRAALSARCTEGAEPYACAWSGILAETTDGESLALFVGACEQGVSWACGWAGWATGKLDKESGAKSAKEWFGRGCQLGDSWSCLRLGDSGPDGDEGRKALEAACPSYPAACEALGSSGSGELALAALTEACAEGRHRACAAVAKAAADRPVLARAARIRACVLDQERKACAGFPFGLNAAHADALAARLCEPGEKACRALAEQLPTSGPAADGLLERRCGPADTRACLWRGLLYERTAPKAAEAAWSTGCEHDHVEACGRLGMLLREGGRHAEAATALDKACRGEQRWACYWHGRSLAELGRAEHAERAFVAACSGEDLHACDEAAKLLASAGRSIPKVVAALTAACSKEDKERCLGLANLLEANGKRSEAEGARGEACRHGHAKACEDLVTRAIKAADAGAAVRAFEVSRCERSTYRCREHAKAISQSPIAPAVDSALAEMCGSEGAASEACVFLGMLREQRFDGLSALDLYAAACAQDINSACYLKGRALLSLKRKDDAVVAFRRGCALNNVVSCGFLGLKTSDPGEAREGLARACDTGYGWACEALGDRLAAAGDSEEALIAWRKGCKARDEDACGDLGDALLAAGEKDAAIAAYQEGCGEGESVQCVGAARLLSEKGDVRTASDLLGRRCRIDTASCLAAVQEDDPEIAKVAADILKRCQSDQPAEGAVCLVAARFASDDATKLVALRLGCERDNALACLELWKQLPDDDENAAAARARSCTLGSSDACAQHGAALLASDPEAARTALSTACDAGMESACRDMARSYPEEDPRAVAAWSKFCEAGDRDDCRTAARRLDERGAGDLAETALRRACSLKSRKGCKSLGQLLRDTDRAEEAETLLLAEAIRCAGRSRDNKKDLDRCTALAEASRATGGALEEVDTRCEAGDAAMCSVAARARMGHSARVRFYLGAGLIVLLLAAGIFAGARELRGRLRAPEASRDE